MGLIISFLSGTVGRLLVGGGIFLAAWLWIKTHYEAKGAAREVAKITQAGARNASKAARIRAKVEALPDDKLHDRYFRDGP